MDAFRQVGNRQFAAELSQVRLDLVVLGAIRVQPPARRSGR
jgi:hypothetical protein